MHKSIRLPEIVVATQQVLALVDLHTGEHRVLDEDRGAYYGITWNDDTLWAIARACEPYRMIALKPDLCECLDFEGLDLGAPDGDSGGPHQIHYHPEHDLLYIADGWNDQVAAYDPDSGVQENLHWPTIGPHKLHINSVWWDFRGMWIVEHRYGDLPKVIRCIEGYDEHNQKAAYFFDLPELAAGPLQQGLHNVYVENGTLFTLGPAQVITMGMRDLQTRIWSLWDHVRPGEHYLRGLARQRDQWLPGLSRWIIGRSNAQSKEDRGFGQSTVLILDESLKVMGELDLPETWGQINEIRLFDKDMSHNSLRCPISVSVWR